MVLVVDYNAQGSFGGCLSFRSIVGVVVGVVFVCQREFNGAMAETRGF